MAKYTPDHRGTGNYLQHSPELNGLLHRRALLGLSMAVALAPKQTGALAASGEVVDEGPNGGIHRDRMEYSLTFDVKHAVPATFNRKHPEARDYLEAAIAVMEAG